MKKASAGQAHAEGGGEAKAWAKGRATGQDRTKRAASITSSRSRVSLGESGTIRKKGLGSKARAMARSRLQWCEKIVDYFEVRGAGCVRAWACAATPLASKLITAHEE
jgi:hypothetical protein